VTVLGIDFGLKRIGIAFSDPADTIAFPGEVLAGSHGECIRQVRQEVASRGATRIVAGMPRNMNGTESPMGRKAEAFADELRRAVSVPVVTWDERLTSREADRAMVAGHLSRRKRKDRIDALAAQLMLQSYLDASHSAHEPFGPPGESNEA